MNAPALFACAGQSLHPFMANQINQRRNSPVQNRHIIFGVILAVIAFLRGAQAVVPPPDGCYPNFTTAEGCNALKSLTAGAANTGVGWYSLFSNTTGNANTGVGAGALALNNTDNNTAVGAGALFLNTTGTENAAVGANALVHNDSGSENNAFGTNALFNNVDGFFNNAHGRNALVNNTGSENNAFGDLAMENNTTGSSNTAIGDDALRSNVDGSGNVAIGDEAGTGLDPSVNNCIAIGALGDGPFVNLDNTCFIGSIFGEAVSDPGTQVPVYVDQFNNVGVFNTSSRRFKHDIQPMDKASETLHRLKPVTFKLNSDWKGTKQYGLIAEEVAEVDPQLVVRGRDGEIMAVHYEQINNMLLNEFLKEHKKVEELHATVAQQQKGMEVLTAQLKEQAAQIQKVSAQLEVSNAAPQVVAKER
jgi:Chaperone of endosialidase